LWAKMSFQPWCPRRETETQGALDHGEPSRSQVQPLPIHTGNGFAVFDWAIGQPSIQRNPRLGFLKLAAPQRIEKVAGKHHALGLALGQTFADEMLNPRVHCLPHLLAEACRAEYH